MASTMYHIRPFLDAGLKIQLPTCMYRMAPTNQETGTIQQSSQTCMPPAASGGAAESSLAQLERRQEEILQRLATLKSQVEAVQRQLGVSASSVRTTMTTATTPLPEHRADLVVVASPSWPPYSVLLLRSLMPTLNVTSHVHSTAPADAAPMAERFNWRGAAGGPQLRIIWKDVSGEPSLMVSVAGQACPLAGEDQLCRYLARALLPHQYEGADGARAARVDHLLDEARRLLHGAARERQAALRGLNSLLGSQPFLLGAAPTLVDGAVWSALRKASLQAPPNVASWSERLAAAADRGKELNAAAGQEDADKKSAADPARTDEPSTTTPTQATPAIPTQHPTATPAPPTAATAGDAHLTEAQLLTYLSELGVQMETVHHPAVFTVEAMLPHLTHVTGALTKNLFLRDKKKALYVLSARHDAEFRLADVAKQVAGARELRFADEAVMWELLGVRQGCVTAFALVNDRAVKVRFLVDSQLLDGTFGTLWFHPLSNEATTGVGVADFRRFLSATGHEPTLVKV